jgi:type IV secretory pathway VirB10-like protein
MSGDDKARFCKSCQKNVFNISLMSRQEAEALIQSREGNGGNLCVRYALREDGTVITNDCPVGLEKAKLTALRPWRFFMAGIAGIVAALCGAFGISTSFAQPPIDPSSRTQKTVSQAMGDIAPITKTNQPNQAPAVLMGGMAAHPTKSQPAPVLMGRPAMPVKQPDNPHILQGGMAPPTAPQCEKPKAVPSASQSRPTTVMVLGKISIKQMATHKATPKTKAAMKKAAKKAPLKKSAKKR